MLHRPLMSVTLCCFASCLLVLVAYCSLLTVRAQSATATLTISVVDQNSAVVPGVALTIINGGTGLQWTVTTNDRGDATISLLPPSTYMVRAQHDGFYAAQIPNIVLNVGDTRAMKIELKVGDVKETVVVNGDTPLINESPSVGTVVDRQFVANIPLNGRSFQSLITLTPGVTLVPAGTSLTQGQFSVNGQRPDANSFMVDGVSGNFGAAPAATLATQSSGSLPGLSVFGTTQTLVSVDALQEFKIETSTYAAELGRQPGGQISLVTRSGTNQFHGNLFEYLRNDKLDANDWFANSLGSARARERQNVFGGTLGGPVLLPKYHGRDRTFFFFSYEGLRLRLPVFALTNVPTLLLRQTAPAALQPVLNAFPLPNGKDLGNGLAEFSASFTNPSSLDALSLRIDHTISQRTTLFGRYNSAPSHTTVRQATVSLNRPQTLTLSTKTLTVGLNTSFNSRVTNEFRINYSDNPGTNSLTLDSFGGAVPVPRTALIPSQFDSTTSQGQIILNFTGRTATALLGSPVDQFISTQRQYQLVDSLVYQAGSHQFKFGVDYRRLSPVSAANSYLLSATFATQQQVLSGTAPSASIQANRPTRPIFDNFSAYGQDTWKPGRRLTLNLGLRWDVNPAPREATGLHPLTLTQTDNLATMDMAPSGTPLWHTTFGNFGPRFGVAYQLGQKSGRETVLRGGFGVFYDSGNNVSARAFSGFPFLVTRTVTNVTYPLSPTQVAPLPLPDTANLTPPFGSAFLFDPHLRLPYTLQWSFAIERSLGKDQTLAVSYVGAAGRRLLQQRSVTLGTLNPKFPTLMQLTTNNSTSDYDALQAQFRRRLSHGLQVQASYTWAHTLDDDSVDTGAFLPVRGNSQNDIRHIFVSAVTYDIPTMRNRAAAAVIGHWSIDSNFHAQTAAPVDITTAFVNSPLDGTLVANRPIVIQGIPLYLYGSQYPGGRIINNTIPTAAQVTAAGCAPLTATNAKGAFCTPPTGTFGNLGRNVVRGLPAWQEDIALQRQFKLTEKVNLQFRAEAFNLFNHPNFGIISTSLAAANFGQATNMLGSKLGGLSPLYQIGGPRSYQFALKLAF